MNEKLINLLCELIKNENVVASWGVSNINIEKSRVSFNVNGLKASGCVTIDCLESQYKILFNTNTIIVSLNDIVPNLDGLIEYSNDYKAQLSNWILKQ